MKWAQDECTHDCAYGAKIVSTVAASSTHRKVQKLAHAGWNRDRKSRKFHMASPGNGEIKCNMENNVKEWECVLEDYMVNI